MRWSGFVTQPREERRRREDAPSMVRWLYGAMILMVLAYLAWLILAHAGSSRYAVNSWGVALFEVMASLLCLASAGRQGAHRGMSLTLGAALLFWSSGDIYLAAVAPTAQINFSDVLYLGFYPLAYVALVLLLRRERRQLIPATWLDGLVAALGSAALCGAFLLGPMERTLGGGAEQVAVNMAFPIGDLLLLALIAGGTATLRSRPQPQWVLLGGACALIALGDTFNLIEVSSGRASTGLVINDVAWPVAILLMSGAMWLAPQSRDHLRVVGTPGFAVPGLGCLVAVGIIFAATARSLNP